eukprot:TRINITY_DN3750_c0_g2_i1.p1 TRINITY_DN3750_c0_g2~~TRINITY_DN3750_c0_g2_i1.p1  ORF type:complete len:372 (+),score=61.64 TRINITY_DN3750_c0_g2_i1:100-1116(+)
MTSHDSAKQRFLQAGEVVFIGSIYIAISAGLITFNKYILSEGRFPHPLELTAMHMIITTIYSLTLCTLAPSLYPSMETALSKKWTVLKYIAPLGLMFAVALFCSNKAYTYSTVAFLQFCKEGNVAIVFFMGCAMGLQSFSLEKVSYLAIIILGCSLCAKGEIHFVMLGLVLQVASMFAECAKNLIGELVMSGGGLKLDALTFVSFQAPCSLMPILVAVAFTLTPQALSDFYAHYPLIVANASLAFLLNVMIAVILKRLSALAFVVIGLTKDIVIVLASSIVFGDTVSMMQRYSFGITLFGIYLWANLKMKEQAMKEQAEKDPEEITPLIAKDKKLETA